MTTKANKKGVGSRVRVTEGCFRNEPGTVVMYDRNRNQCEVKLDRGPSWFGWNGDTRLIKAGR